MLGSTRHRPKAKGFTLVEVLIVVVVIAILTAITVVAYNGVQQRARDSQRMSDLAVLAKAVMRWSIENGQPVSAMAAGSGGTAIGWFDGAYTPYPSVQQTLVNSGYTSANIHDPLNVKSSPYYAYMITTCNNSDTSIVRVLLAHLEIAPSKSISQQIGTTCTSGTYTTYTATYGMNYGVLVTTG